MHLLISFVTSALVALCLMPWLLRLCHKHQIYDLPAERKVHKNGVPRLGGVVFIPAMLAGMLAGFAIMGASEQHVPYTIHTSSIIIALGGMMVYAIGIIDDLIGVSAGMKFIVQIMAAMTFPFCGLYLDSLYGFLGIYELPLWISYALTVCITLLITNAVNLIDGIDGVAACFSLIALATYGYVFYLLGATTFVICCTSLSGALITFLFFNILGDAEKRTKSFMGDSGSLLLGIVLSYLTLKYAMRHAPTLPYRADGLLVAYSALLVPCFDAVRMTFCRLRRRQNIFRADKTHIHHKLIAAGLTMSQALVALVLLQVSLMALNIALFRADVRMEIIILVDGFIYTLINVLLPVAPQTPHRQKVFQYNDNSVRPAEMEYKGEESLVSIIMPTYNAAKFVGESIESIMAQTYTNWELIITDDKSTDNTLSILRDYARRDARIKIQENAQNSGAGFSRNASISAARGRYIAFCDSDDRWMPKKLELQLAFMAEKDVKICFAPYYTCDEHSQYLGYVPAARHVNLFSMIYDNKIGFLTCIYDANECGKHYMPLQRKRQDYAFLLNLMRTYPHAYSVPEPLAHYRLHQDNISGNKISLLRYNALTYHVVFGWSMPTCYVFLFVVFVPYYFFKRAKNICINIWRTQLG